MVFLKTKESDSLSCSSLDPFEVRPEEKRADLPLVKKKIIGRFKFLSALFILELYKAEVANICLKNGMREGGKKKPTVAMQACSRGTQICHLQMRYIVTVTPRKWMRVCC